METSFKIAITSVPNDTYLFCGWALKFVAGPAISQLDLVDIENLNKLAIKCQADIIKISFSAYSQVKDNYIMLPVGCTIVENSGPVIASRKTFTIRDLSSKSIAIPGKMTTAYLLTGLLPRFMQEIECPYDMIIPKILSQQVDCGLLIHESAWSIKNFELCEVFDLFKLWHDETRLPLPLGGIAVKRSLGNKTIQKIYETLKDSIQFADNPQNKSIVENYMASRALNHTKESIQNCLAKWINSETRQLSPKGQQAIEQLLKLAKKIHSHQTFQLKDLIFQPNS